MKLIETRNLTALTVSAVALFALGAAGCSGRTQQAASNTVESAGQDAENHARATGEAVKGAGREIKQETKEAAHNASEAVGGAVKSAAKETQDAGQVLTITPKVKNALVSSKDIDASTINVDTSGEKDTVVLKGTVRSAKEKQLAEQITKKTLMDNKSTFKVKNELTVAGK